MRDGGPIDLDVVFITESKELLSGELRAVVRDDGVWDSKAMDDVEEEQHGCLDLTTEIRRASIHFVNFVNGDKQVGVAPGCPF